MKLSEKVRIDKSRIDGNGCFSNIVIRAGEFIGTFEGYTPKRESKFVLYCVNGSCRRGTNELRCLNHDDFPNATFNGYRLYAIEDIYPDDEITIDYGPMWNVD